jgi:hypothetical protein
MGIAYPHYWVKHDVITKFRLCLTILKDHFMMPENIRRNMFEMV